MEHIGGYFIAIDVSDRDFQNIAKEKGHPWTLAKCQDRFCIVSELIQ
jgi:acylpyruvate hydrolase